MGALWFFLSVLKLDLVGIGLACVVTNFVLMVALEVYARCCVEELRSAFTSGVDDDDFVSEDESKPLISMDNGKKYKICDKDGMKEYFELGGPSVAALCSEAWAYQIMSFVAASFGVDYQAAHIVLSTIIAVEFEVGVGLIQATSNTVGLQIGKNNPEEARNVYWNGNKMSFIIMFVTVSGMMLAKE